MNARIFLSIIMATAIVGAPLAGCSSKRSSTVETTEVRRDADTDRPYTQDEAVQVTKIEKTTETERPRGLFGILGDIIALPFRAVGSIL